MNPWAIAAVAIIVIFGVIWYANSGAKKKADLPTTTAIVQIA